METLQMSLTGFAFGSLLLYFVIGGRISFRWENYRKTLVVIPFLGRFGVIRGYDAASTVLTSFVWWFVFCVLPLSAEMQLSIVTLKTAISCLLTTLFFIASYFSPIK